MIIIIVHAQNDLKKI